MLLDAHAHLDHYDQDKLPTALAEIAEHQILTLTNSIHPRSYRRSLEIARQSRWIVPSFGIHPWQAADYVDQLNAYTSLIEQSLLLGEIGLDYRWVHTETFPAQREVFEFFLAAAQAQDKIVNLHTKDAEADVLHWLDQYNIRRAIVHWYSGPLDILQQMIERGFYFTIGVELAHSAHIRAVAQAVPLDQLLTETDNPGGLKWLMGEMGYPRHLLAVLPALAGVKGISVDELKQIVADNFWRLVEGDLNDLEVRSKVASGR